MVDHTHDPNSFSNPKMIERLVTFFFFFGVRLGPIVAIVHEDLVFVLFFIYYVRTYVVHMLRTYVILYYNWLIL